MGRIPRVPRARKPAAHPRDICDFVGTPRRPRPLPAAPCASERKPQTAENKTRCATESPTTQSRCRRERAWHQKKYANQPALQPPHLLLTDKATTGVCDLEVAPSPLQPHGPRDNARLAIPRDNRDASDAQAATGAHEGNKRGHSGRLQGITAQEPGSKNAADRERAPRVWNPTFSPADNNEDSSRPNNEDSYMVANSRQTSPPRAPAAGKNTPLVTLIFRPTSQEKGLRGVSRFDLGETNPRLKVVAVEARSAEARLALLGIRFWGIDTAGDAVDLIARIKTAVPIPGENATASALSERPAEAKPSAGGVLAPTMRKTARPPSCSAATVVDPTEPRPQPALCARPQQLKPPYNVRPRSAPLQTDSRWPPTAAGDGVKWGHEDVARGPFQPTPDIKLLKLRAERQQVERQTLRSGAPEAPAREVGIDMLFSGERRGHGEIVTCTARPHPALLYEKLLLRSLAITQKKRVAEVADAFLVHVTNTPLAAMNGPFTALELERALTMAKGKSTPAPDGITFQCLRNLDEDKRARLLAYFNLLW
ncbi:hypothetical protein HPB48_026374 [Haemaphysalis longicornis]|uniref:Uncharacterized protein n=1 Tax=Haemaphysalis longicornis TaxID=44386 RepID=A0A9J6H0Z3_HAELO|nr:hypothetical protein HPB48_026374 [Haemaphysalis longicornis]